MSGSFLLSEMFLIDDLSKREKLKALNLGKP